MLRLISSLLLALGLLGCAVAPQHAATPNAAEMTPWLALSPASLGIRLDLQQRLTFSHPGGEQSVDALLEIEPEELRLVLHTLGQPALRLSWNGVDLQETRGEGVPPALSGERVLSDLQLVYWPAAVIISSLPSGWRFEDIDGVRRLYHGAVLVVSVTPAGANRLVLEQHVTPYRLTIDSASMDSAPLDSASTQP